MSAKLISLVVLAILCAAAVLSAEETRPNIVFILADDLGYGDLGCYGQQRIKTPNIDKLASEGMRFTQCYAGSTVCAPSRCALMTARHTGHCTIRGNKDVPLTPDDLTVASILKKAGYATGMFGKWGLGELGSSGVPSRHGFDEFFGYLNQTHAHNYYPEFLIRNDAKVEIEKNKNNQRGAYSEDLFLEESMSFLERKKDQPFFLYVPLTIPHGNNEAIKRGETAMQVPSDEPYSNENWPRDEKNFAAMVTRLDRDVGRILSRLKELGLEEKTIVFFASDNGPHHEGHDPKFFKSGGELRGIKRDLYEGGIRIPMIARWPGKIKAGASSGRAWAFWDFPPTAADLAGAEIPAGIDGISMKAELLGQPQKDHEYLYWEFHERGFSQAVLMGKWKGVRLGPQKPVELYDLSADIGEEKNIAADHPDVVAKITALLTEARTDSKDFPVNPGKK